MRILSADIGIVNLAFCLLDVDEKQLGDAEKPEIRVLDVWHINITVYTHKAVPQNQCKLYHSREIGDRLMHALQEHEPLWDAHGPIDLYLIEQQPLVGITSVEALLFQRYRSKIRKVLPTSMHKWLNLSNDYETRKVQTVELATPWLESFPVFANATRRHDVSDSFVLACYEIHRMHEKAKVAREAAKRKRRIEEACQSNHGKSMEELFESFRCKKPKVETIK